MPNSNPVSAWKALKDGNARFVAGEPLHPSQSIELRASLRHTQKPTAVVFGCGDSRVAAEISRIRERALWAMIAGQAHTGGFALCKAGAVVEERSCDGDTWEDLPNLALARFAGVRGADIHYGFHHPAEPLTANTSYIVVTDRGEFLDPPRPVAARDIAGFSHLL